VRLVDAPDIARGADGDDRECVVERAQSSPDERDDRRLRVACGISDDDAYFIFDSAALENNDISPLDAIARCFTVGPLKGRAMRLVGHADPRGSSEYNLVLGQRRADSVEGYLDRHGVGHSHLATTSRGSMDATGHDEASWTRDRRVDVTLGSG
jgi:peptidoglycan-associated lipoprotein